MCVCVSHPVVEGVLWASKATEVAAVSLCGKGTGGRAGCRTLAKHWVRPCRSLLQGHCGIAHSSEVHLLPGITHILRERERECETSFLMEDYNFDMCLNAFIYSHSWLTLAKWSAAFLVSPVRKEKKALALWAGSQNNKQWWPNSLLPKDSADYQYNVPKKSDNIFFPVCSNHTFLLGERSSQSNSEYKEAILNDVSHPELSTKEPLFLSLSPKYWNHLQLLTHLIEEISTLKHSTEAY